MGRWDSGESGERGREKKGERRVKEEETEMKVRGGLYKRKERRRGLAK